MLTINFSIFAGAFMKMARLIRRFQIAERIEEMLAAWLAAKPMKIATP